MADYTISDLQHEVQLAKKTVRKEHKGQRVYFDEARLHLGNHVCLQVPYNVADGNGGLHPTDYHNIAI